MRIILCSHRGQHGKPESEVEEVELSSFEEQYSTTRQTFIEMRVGDKTGIVKVEELEKAIQALKV